MPVMFRIWHHCQRITWYSSQSRRITIQVNRWVVPHYKFNSTFPLLYKITDIIECPAEIVKHFEILVTRFSPRASWRTAVLTKAVTFEISRHGALGIYRLCVCCRIVYSDGVHYKDSAWISPWNESTLSPICKCSPSMGKPVSWRRLCRV